MPELCALAKLPGGQATYVEKYRERKFHDVVRSKPVRDRAMVTGAHER